MIGSMFDGIGHFIAGIEGAIHVVGEDGWNPGLAPLICIADFITIAKPPIIACRIPWRMNDGIRLFVTLVIGTGNPVV